MRGGRFYRGLDENSFSLHFTLSEEWDYMKYVKSDFSDQAREFLLSKKNLFEKIVADILNSEPGLNVRKVKLSDPFLRRSPCQFLVRIPLLLMV